jgi:succinate dehydrogenase / fumarate reductase flavoprotein subunit
MSEQCGVVRAESGLREGLRALGDIRERTRALEIRPDIAGYADLAHAFDLHGSLLTARATMECALERRETRGAHNRTDFPAQDPALLVNLVWTTDGPIAHEPIAAPSARVAALAGGQAIEIAGRLLE